MKSNYLTSRLVLNELKPGDESFIIELVNTPEWIKFIGDRKIRTQEDATSYIQKILNDPNVNYWLVRLQEQNIPIGVVTFMKRHYLEHYDIGFAFLPKFGSKGYAYEATKAVLTDIISDSSHSHILATTLKENIKSIKLLEKLGFRYEKEIENESEFLSVYSATVDKLSIDQITTEFFNLFTNARQQKPALDKIHYICMPETIILKKIIGKEEVFTIEQFIEPRIEILSNGTLTEFEEYELSEDTRVVNNIAQRFSKYQKKGYLNGIYFEVTGNKLFSYVKTEKAWKIVSIVWEDNII
jgi:RimJ/RimL family protein N-acetyltransferase